MNALIILDIFVGFIIIPTITTILLYAFKKGNLNASKLKVLQKPDSFEEWSKKEKKEFLVNVVGIKCFIYSMLIFMVIAIIAGWFVITIPLALDVPYIIREEPRSIDGIVIHDSRDNIIIAVIDNDMVEERRFSFRTSVSVGTYVRVEYLPNTERLVSITRIVRALEE